MKQSLTVIEPDRRPNTTAIHDLDWYDHFLVSFSGGKDSVALALELLKRGIPAEKIRLMHQHVDGEPGVDAPFMDWPCTESYCRAFAEAMKMPLTFQWRHGGFQREMLKENATIAPVSFELMDGGVGTAGGKKGKVSTRRQFPQVSSNLSVRWCSSALKIDVASIAINNEPRFKNSRILFLSGERREESAARAKYAEMEEHRTHTKSRHVDHWRMVIDWTEEQVWAIMREFGIVPHPAYRLGWSRVSCLACIFGLADQWASVRLIAPSLFAKIAAYEVEFGKTIHQGKSVIDLANRGTPYASCQDQELVALAMGNSYHASLIKTNEWVMPAGAFRHGGGPT